MTENIVVVGEEYQQYDKAVVELGAAKRFCEAIYDAYPHHMWSVEVDLSGRVAKLHNRILSVSLGYVVRLEGKTLDEVEKILVHGAGQILERYNLSRRKGHNILEEMQNLPRNTLEEVDIPDVVDVDAGPLPKWAKKQAS